jgi:FHS family L-fucose permease-like MFS transporter
MNTLGAALAFIVPAICLTLVACQALFDLRTARHRGALTSEGAAP